LLLHFYATVRIMNNGYDFLAEAEAAMKRAAAAACEHDRLRWMHVAQVWQDLGRCVAQVASISPKPQRLARAGG
jgi:hypothetical protein